MKKIWAITVLTLRAAVRFRLVWVLGLLLVGSVVLLPLLIKDDGTARGFTQILLTYTLSAITGLLGISTLWLACGVLARDIEESQIQMVVVKPVSRWQIWLGKWLGIVILNAVLLALSGVSVYGLLLYRAQKLPPNEQAILRNEVLVARNSLKEPTVDFAPFVEERLQKLLKENPTAQVDVAQLRRQLTEQFKASEQIVDTGQARRWQIDLGFRKLTLKDQPLFVRTKFIAAQTNASGTYPIFWEIGPTNGLRQPFRMSLAPETFHEFVIAPNLFDDKGVLTIDMLNYNETALLFTLEDGLEVLYREGGFGLNFARGLGIIFCWLALMTTLGLTAGSFLSFPVAAFLSIGFLIVGSSSSVLSQTLEEGSIMGVNHDTGVADKKSAVDYVALPVFAGLLKVVNLVQDFSPVEALSSGRSITWGVLGLAVVQIVFLMGGVIAAIGMVVFSRRELAAAQSNS